MRIFLVIIGVIFCFSGWSQNVEQYPPGWRIDKVEDLSHDSIFLNRVEKFKRLNSQNPESREASRATRDLYYYVDTWHDIQPDRNEGLLKVNQALEPLKPLLIELNEKKVGHRSHNMRLLGYLKPDDQIIELSYHFLEDHENPVWSAAMNSIFLLKADTPEFRQRIGQRIEEAITKKDDYESTMLMQIVGQWKVKEAVPSLIFALQNGITGAAKPLKSLGVDAKEALPELRKQLEKAKAEGARFQVIEALEFAINSVSGNPPLRSVRNNTIATNQQLTSTQTQTNVFTPKTETQQEAKNLNWLRWLLAAVGISVVGFYCLVFSEKRM